MIPDEAIDIFRRYFGDAVDGAERLERWNGFDVFHVLLKQPMTVGYCTFVLGKDGKYRLASLGEAMELCTR